MGTESRGQGSLCRGGPLQQRDWGGEILRREMAGAAAEAAVWSTFLIQALVQGKAVGGTFLIQ